MGGWLLWAGQACWHGWSAASTALTFASSLPTSCRQSMTHALLTCGGGAVTRWFTSAAAVCHGPAACSAHGWGGLTPLRPEAPTGLAGDVPPASPDEVTPRSGPPTSPRDTPPGPDVGAQTPCPPTELDATQAPGPRAPQAPIRTFTCRWCLKQLAGWTH